VQKFFFSLISLFLFSIAGLIAYPLLVDLEAYEKELQKAVKEVTGLNATINGGLTVSFFPQPMLKAERFYVENVEGAISPHILKVASVQVNASIERLIKGEVNLNDVILVRPEIYLEEFKDGRKSWNVFSEQLAKQESSAALSKTLHINNGMIVYRAQGKEQVIEHMVSDISIDVPSATYKITGSMDIGAHAMKVDGRISQKGDSPGAMLKVSSDSLSLDFNGSYEKSKVLGDLSLNILSAGEFVEAFFINSPVLAQIKANEAIEAKAKIAFTKDKLSATNLVVNSKTINGSGRIEAFLPKSKDEDIIWEVNLALDHLDLDTLTFIEQKKVDSKEVDYYASTLHNTNLLDYRLDVSQDFSAILYLHAKSIKWRKQEIKDFLFDANFYSGSAMIHSLSALLPGNASIEVGGNIKHNGIRPLFDGRVKASGDKLRSLVTWIYPELSFIPQDRLKEFLLTSDVVLTPRKMAFSGFRLSFDKSLLSGALNSRPADKIPSSKLDIRLDRFDFDSYGLTREIDRYVKHTLLTAKDESLDSSWLRMFSSRVDFTVDAKDLTYNKSDISSLLMGGNVSSGALSLQRFILNADKAQLDLSTVVNLRGDIPELNIYASSKGFDTSFLILDDEIAQGPKKSQVDEEGEDQGEGEAKDSTKKVAQKSDDEKEEWTWSEEPFNFLGLHRFNGKVKLGIKVFRHRNALFKKLKVSGELERNLFQIKELSGNFYDGKFDIRGSLDISNNSSMALSFALTKVDIDKLSAVFGKRLGVKGDGYFTGVIRTFGGTPKKWVSELNLKTKVVGRNITLSGIDLQSIIRSSRGLYSVIDMDKLVKKAMKSGETVFDSVEGDLITEKGLISAKDFKLSSGYARGAVVAKIDPKTLLMKSITKIAYMPEPGKNVVLNLKSQGSFEKFETSLDTTQLENYITGKAVQ
jgi:uncharacterized protein involved in outer membrane biogenesis